MNSSNPDNNAADWGLPELAVLADLGFGPASQLMTEPKLFVDTRFLGALQVEFEEELGPDTARTVLFQIGLMHGLRDALAVSDLEAATPGLPQIVSSSPLAMQLGAIRGGETGFSLDGSWPDGHEAEARVKALGRSAACDCTLSAGYTSGWLSGALDVEMLAVETACSAAGADACTFHAREVGAWEGDADAPEETLSLLRSQSIRALRELIEQQSRHKASIFSTDVPRLPTQADGEEPAVHIWGPVMVMPFTDVDTAVATVEMLGSDPAVRSVRVVVLDLEGTILDEAFGAAGLERLIEDVEAWGSDIVLTGVSPLSEDVIADLATEHLLIRKDLPEAIAYAFQIAEAHQHLL